MWIRSAASRTPFSAVGLRVRLQGGGRCGADGGGDKGHSGGDALEGAEHSIRR